VAEVEPAGRASCILMAVSPFPGQTGYPRSGQPRPQAGIRKRHGFDGLRGNPHDTNRPLSGMLVNPVEEKGEE